MLGRMGGAMSLLRSASPDDVRTAIAMNASPKAFVSAVSGDLRGARLRVRDALLNTCCHLELPIALVRSSAGCVNPVKSSEFRPPPWGVRGAVKPAVRAWRSARLEPEVRRLPNPIR